KIISLFVLFFVSLIFGLLPVKIITSLRKKDARGLQCERLEAQAQLQTAVSYLNCVAGGVFLATSFLHLLPEVEEATQQLLLRLDSEIEFPVAAFLCGCGFFLIMIVEHCVMQLQHHHSDVPYDQSVVAKGYKPISNSSEKEAAISDKKTGYGSIEVEHCESQPSHLHSYIHEQLKNPQLSATNTTLHGIRAFILLLALSLHTVFEGMALGLQPTTSLLWTLTGAISLHKAVISFSMGMQFTEKLADMTRVVLFLVFFSFMAPIGVAIGTLVGALGSPDSLATMIASVSLQGLATGTFIYVTFFEVLQKEVGQNHGVLKVFAIMAGYAVIAVMKLL
ncbi:hypothetical protein CAPTEDRAFT_26618, partial [Capitella teleta]